MGGGRGSFLRQSRGLSFTGKILVIKAEALPLLVFLARVFPLPPRLRRTVKGVVFRFLWGGYEYVGRDVMVQPVDKGGRVVLDVVLKLDVLYYTTVCKMLAKQESHPAFCFIRLWMSWSLRFLVRWDNIAPKAEQLPPHYRHAVMWAGKYPQCRDVELCVDHRALYAAVLEQVGGVRVQRVPVASWRAAQIKGLENRVRDLSWLMLHQRLPVREVLYTSLHSALHFHYLQWG